MHVIEQKNRGGTVLAAYLANKQRFVPFHPIKALDRPKTQAALPSRQASCHKSPVRVLLPKLPTSKPGTPLETQHSNNRRHGWPRQPGSPSKPSKRRRENTVTLLPHALPTTWSARTHKHYSKYKETEQCHKLLSLLLQQRVQKENNHWPDKQEKTLQELTPSLPLCRTWLPHKTSRVQCE